MNSSDFKQRVTQKAERYKFAGASDEEKSELLKDVLAMANADRDGAGQLLLGFKGGGRLIPQRPLVSGRTAPVHKWWPIKRAEQTFVRVGNSSQWRLVLDFLRWTDVALPEEGVPFAVILTLDDPKGQAPVFNDLRQALRASGAQIDDIRTAARVKPLGRL